MRQYKGYYIDKVIFKSEAEIDKFLEKQALDAYKMACQLFAERSTLENSIYCNEKARDLLTNSVTPGSNLRKSKTKFIKRHKHQAGASSPAERNL